MAHFPQSPTVVRQNPSTLTQRNLLRVCGSGRAGNVRHTLYDTQCDVNSEEIIFLFLFVDHCMPTQTDVLAQ